MVNSNNTHNALLPTPVLQLHQHSSPTFLHEDVFVDEMKSLLLDGDLYSNNLLQRAEPELLLKQKILQTRRHEA